MSVKIHTVFLPSLLALLISGCSSSDSSEQPTINEADITNVEAAIEENIEVNNVEVNNGSMTVGGEQSGTTTGLNENTSAESVATNNIPPESTITESETINDIPTEPIVAATRVNFDITVPEYVSNALEVRLIWGATNTRAMWVTDESWSIELELPTRATNQLMVIFNDDNGATTLGSFETEFQTGTSEAESFVISAAQFDTDRWDNDNDGISNLAELLAGSSPLSASELASTDAQGITDSTNTIDGPDTTREFEEFNFVDVADDLIHLTSGCQMTRLSTVVEDLAYIIEDTNTIIWPDNNWYQVQIVANNDGAVFDTVCNGGAECKLLPGKHAVINQTTGERSLLDVLPIELEDNPNAAQLPETVITTAGTIFPPATVPLTRVQHACEHGGSFTREMGVTAFDGNTYRPQNFIFDQCQMTIRSGRLPDGNYRVDGALELLSIGFKERTYFENFSIVGDSGLEYHVQNGLLNGGASFNNAVTVTSYEKKLPNEEVGESLTDVAFSYDGSLDYRLSSSGVVRSDKTADQHVTIRTDVPLNYELSSGVAVTPFNGSIEMLAEDGSIMNLNPVPLPTQSPIGNTIFTIELDATSRDGENISGSMNSYSPRIINERFRDCAYLGRNRDFRRWAVVEPIP